MATPCKSLGRYAQNDKCLRFLLWFALRFCRALRRFSSAFRFFEKSFRPAIKGLQNRFVLTHSLSQGLLLIKSAFGIDLPQAF